MTTKRWIVRKHDRNLAVDLGRSLGVSPLLAALLISRGYDTETGAQRFLHPSLEDLHDPFLLKGIQKAVRRIIRALEHKETILIWGDYDVDGTTGTVLFRQLFRLLGIETRFHIPNRFTEGYGLNIPFLEEAKKEGVSLVITVDCGIRAFEPVEWAKRAGMDVIITDHHLADESKGVPSAFEVINPNQPGCPYPEKHLAGVGVAMKLAQAVLVELGLDNTLPDLMGTAAIGTVADVVDLTGENRAIVALGLRGLPDTENHGLRALMEIAECRSNMTSYHIGYRIGPRINAAGRMDAAKYVVDLFEAQTPDAAKKFARLLDEKNRERQAIQNEVTESAIDLALGSGNERFIVVAGKGWHRGVVGLAASRIAERCNRPAIVLSVSNGMAHGSARSIRNYHLLEALETCSDLFEDFGGHAAAAGMTLREENILQLRMRLNLHAENNIGDDDLIPTVNIDAMVSTTSLSIELANELQLLEPFGAGNQKPVFATGGLFLRYDPMVMKEKHLKLYLADNQGRRFEAVWWNGVELGKGQTLSAGSGIELAYSLELNHWQGENRLQLVVKDLREHN